MEAGFTITTSGSQLSANNLDLSGNTVISSPGGIGQTGTLIITEDDATDPFRFVSIELDGNGAPSALPTVTVSGFLNGVFVGTDSFQTGQTSSTFLALNLLDASLDELRIELPTTDIAGNNAASFADNIHLNPASIPLPAAAWLLLGGLGALGVVARRRRQEA